MGSESGRATTIRKVIPVNERCWHVFRQDNAKRMQLEYYAAFGEKPYDTVNISELRTSN